MARFPRSTLVMAALTCIPFGLAVRDYLSGKDKVETEDDEALEDYAEIEAARAEQERAAARDEERRAAVEAALAKLIGEDAALLGPAFGAIRIGMTESELAKLGADTAAVRKLARAHDLVVNYDDTDGVLQSISIEPSTSAELQGVLCEKIGVRLVENWSGSEVTDDTVRSWVNPERGARAEFPTDDALDEECAVTFRRYAPVESWIGKTNAMVPLDAIGQPHAKLVARLEPQRVDLSNAEHQITWIAPGLGHGLESTEITAHVVKGKVVALSAVAVSSLATTSKLEEHLHTLFGESTLDEENTVHWKRKPGATLTREYAIASGAAPRAILVTVGPVPEQQRGALHDPRRLRPLRGQRSSAHPRHRHRQVAPGHTRPRPRAVRRGPARRRQRERDAAAAPRVTLPTGPERSERSGSPCVSR